ncbi:TetR/AcrR family transcriptional regulator, partial [Xanthomonas citri pv. citri]
HKDTLIDQIAAILADGVKQGVFAVDDVKLTARTIFDTTSRFHHPGHAEEWKDADLQTRMDATLALLLRGLKA